MTFRIAAILSLLIAPLSARPDCEPQLRPAMSCCEPGQFGSCCCDVPEPAPPEPQSTAAPNPERFEAAPTAVPALSDGLADGPSDTACAIDGFLPFTGSRLRAITSVRNN